jgi:hypothetical protein
VEIQLEYPAISLCGTRGNRLGGGKIVEEPWIVPAGLFSIRIRWIDSPPDLALGQREGAVDAGIVCATSGYRPSEWTKGTPCLVSTGSATSDSAETRSVVSIPSSPTEMLNAFFV